MNEPPKGEFLTGMTYRGEVWIGVSLETETVNIIRGDEYFTLALTKSNPIV